MINKEPRYYAIFDEELIGFRAGKVFETVEEAENAVFDLSDDTSICHAQNFQELLAFTHLSIRKVSQALSEQIKNEDVGLSMCLVNEEEGTLYYQPKYMKNYTGREIPSQDFGQRRLQKTIDMI